jgi:prepilin-type N-terminal cleavage/methylation domain-containing protein
MNNKNKSLPGFTVIELLIVMLLSGIVVGITYLYFTQFQSYLRQTSVRSDQYFSAGQLHMVLQHDMEQAQQVFFSSPDELHLHLNETEIEYVFDAEYIVRKHPVSSDTFQIQILDIKVDEMEDYQDLVKTIELETRMNNQDLLRFELYKDYTAKTLFNLYQE